MKKLLPAIILVFCLLVANFTSCPFGLNFAPFGKEDVAARFEKEADAYTDLGTLYEQAGDEYTFLLFTDIHFGKMKMDSKDLVSFVTDYGQNHTESPLRFVLFLGDAADHGQKEEYDLYTNFESEVMAAIRAGDSSVTDGIRGQNFLAVMGNHDLFMHGYSRWKKSCYPFKESWKFTVRTGSTERSFYCGDTSMGVLGSNQLDMLNAKLREDKNPKIFLTHSPISQLAWNKSIGALPLTIDQDDRVRLQKLLFETKTDLYLCGHNHFGGEKPWPGMMEVCFRSFTECQGNQYFYTVTVNESEKKAVINQYGLKNWKSGVTKSITASLR